jgi:hypothetical protein
VELGALKMQDRKKDGPNWTLEKFEHFGNSPCGSEVGLQILKVIAVSKMQKSQAVRALIGQNSG